MRSFLRWADLAQLAGVRLGWEDVDQRVELVFWRWRGFFWTRREAGGMGVGRGTGVSGSLRDLCDRLFYLLAFDKMN